MPSKPPPKEVTVMDVARKYNVHQTTAWRWLEALHREHGATIVKRQGNHLSTTWKALSTVRLPPEDEQRYATQKPSPWKELAELAGGLGPLAEDLGISYMTLHRWASGERKPRSRITRRAVNDYARKRHQPPPWPEDE